MKKEALLLFISVILSIGFVCGQSSEYFKLKWDYVTASGIKFLELEDLDADGREEVVAVSVEAGFGGAAGWLDVLDKDKNCLSCGTGKTHTLPGYPSAMALGDVNGDGRKEILLGVFSRLHLRNSRGEEIWELSPKSGSDVTSIYIGDINNDGVNEIIVGVGTESMRNYLFAFTPQGDIVWSTIVSGSVQVIAAEDIDDDGIKEILVGAYGRWTMYSTPASMQIFDSTGKQELVYPTQGGVASIAVEDINSDGAKEIIVGTYKSLMVLDNRGVNLWTYSTGGLIRRIHVLDLDNDSTKEIILGSSDIYVLRPDGTLKWSNPVGGEVNDMRLVDLNRDGIKEILVGCNDGAYILSSDNKVVWSRKTSGVNSIDVGDLEGDNYVELAFGGTDKRVYVFQAESYIKEQEAYNYLKLAESTANKRDYVNAIKYAQQAKNIYMQINHTHGKENAQLLLSRLESEASRFSQEETAAEDYYNKATKAYVEGDYINAIKNAEKAKAKYSYLKNYAAVNKCTELIENSRSYLKLEAEACLKNASELYAKRNYSAVVEYATKAAAGYAYMNNEEETHESLKLLAESYKKISEAKRSSGEFNDSAVSAQKALYLYNCVSDMQPTSCNIENIQTKNITKVWEEIASKDYSDKKYRNELLEVKSLIKEINSGNTGNPLDSLIKWASGNLIFILFGVLALTVFILLISSVYLIAKHQKTKRDEDKTPFGRRWAGEETYEDKASRLEDLSEPDLGDELPKIRRDRLVGLGINLKRRRRRRGD